MTMFKRLSLASIGLIAVVNLTHAKNLISSDKVPVMLEVFSSQGCSSCPPAEAWLNGFRADQGLWQTLVPINFHVDYWDYLGWADPYANSEYSLRQRDYQHFKHIKTVATPGFVVDGKGWNGWFVGQNVPVKQRVSPGKLTAKIGHQSVEITYIDHEQQGQSMTATIAVLGFDQETSIGRGENQGRKLIHDFIVLNHSNKMLSAENNQYHTSMPMPDISRFSSAKTAVVVWISQGMDPQPIQVVADWQ